MLSVFYTMKKKTLIIIITIRIVCISQVHNTQTFACILEVSIVFLVFFHLHEWTRRFHVKSILFSQSFDYYYGYQMLVQRCIGNRFFFLFFPILHLMSFIIIINEMYGINCHYSHYKCSQLTKRKPFFSLLIILSIKVNDRYVFYSNFFYYKNTLCHKCGFDQMIITLFN